MDCYLVALTTSLDITIKGGSRHTEKEGRSWAGTGEELGMCRIGACKEQGRSMAGVGQQQELGRSRERGSGRHDDESNQKSAKPKLLKLERFAWSH